MKYKITNTGSDWLLKIWEPVPVTPTRDLPFLYKIKLRFASEKDALRMLAHYRDAYENEQLYLNSESVDESQLAAV
jgi:hypothetical protein